MNIADWLKLEDRLTPQAREALSDPNFKIAVNEAELLVMGQVGDPWEALDSKSVSRWLAEHKGEPVNVRINSPGGLAFDGLSIHNALIRHDAQVTVNIEGIAASAAAIIAMAGDPLRIAENGSLFIHRAHGLAYGNASVMLDTAEFLETLDRQIAVTLGGKAGKKTEDVLALMTGKSDGTLYDAQGALEAGFVDEVVPLREPSENALAASQAAALADLAGQRRDWAVRDRVASMGLMMMEP